MRPGDIVVASLAGAVQIKIRPAVVIASESYIRDRPDVTVGILTTQIPQAITVGDYVLEDWRQAGLRAPSCFRMYVITVRQTEATVVGHVSHRDWSAILERIRLSFAQV